MKQVAAIAHYEMVHILKDKILLYWCLPSLLYASSAAWSISQDSDGYSLAIVDLDNSRLSREVVAAFENSPRFQVVRDRYLPGWKRG